MDEEAEWAEQWFTSRFPVTRAQRWYEELPEARKRQVRKLLADLERDRTGTWVAPGITVVQRGELLGLLDEG